MRVPRPLSHEDHSRLTGSPWREMFIISRVHFGGSGNRTGMGCCRIVKKKRFTLPTSQRKEPMMKKGVDVLLHLVYAACYLERTSLSVLCLHNIYI